ncbi:MAG: tetratricopeptide repeat protein [Inhella sp.]|uniref:tetratricopeptide repeat protein n=1 Tax=Inhella sp. TaxID=1921806 RepID=UPI0022BDC4D9|nr:tetratricopeptide repeat protein [Inhella sp.]MCZ8236082.1 tetratricopeptide repeat protein [Inhella sp.]
MVKLEPKQLEVLFYLLQHAGEVVTKQELLDEVWAGRVLSDAVLTKCIARLRQGLGDESQAIIKTVHGYGYRLVAAVQVETSPAPSLPQIPELNPGDAPPLRPQWALVRRLGSGAMGEAWLAQHGKTGEKRVFKFGLDAGSLTSLKREITLYRVLHDSLGPRPDLVRLLDWNLNEVPFYVESEYVEHGSLPDWADSQGGWRQIALTQRLELMAQVADALAAAHSVGVLHKDLKPSNVLVADDRGSPQVRLADFGSGQLVDLARLEALEITRLGFTATQVGADSGGTPFYLAPEVLAGQAPTARSDIYALGVMLYQCITGDTRKPLAPGWESDVDDPLLREDIAAAAAGDASQRLGDASLLAQRLRSLEARRSERAAELAAQDEAQRLRELLESSRKRRRQWGFASAGLAVVLCVVSLLLLQVRKAEQRSRNDAEIAAAVNQFLTQDLLGQANPLVSGRSDVRVRDLLDAAAKNVGTRFTGRPVAEASVRAALGNAYLGLGQFTPAQAELESALRLAEASGEADTIAINARVDLGALHTRRSEYAKARDVLAPLLAHADPAVRVRGEIATAFALMAEGDFKSALARLREVRPRVETLLGPTSTEALTTLSYLASAHRQLGQYKEAIVLYRQALAGQEAQQGKGHVATLEAMRSLGGALYLSGALAEALPVLESASKLSVELNGPRHDRTLNSLSDLALVKQDLKDYPGAEALMLSTLEVRGAEYGKDSADYRTLLNNLGVLYGDMGDPVRQHQYLAQGCAAEKAASGPSSPDTLICHHNLARALVDLKRYAEAAALEQETMALAEPVFGAEHAYMGVFRYTHAAALGYLGRTRASEQQFGEAIALLDKVLGPGNERTAKAIELRDKVRAAMGAEKN